MLRWDFIKVFMGFFARRYMELSDPSLLYTAMTNASSPPHHSDVYLGSRG